ncbi:MAG: SUMF1/EgtB/PvdO family nonheme iron enzyme [Spirochaetaceae bacterium]|nr:SUMF1/EgtB/PvdO family nonheme iron enzyme [Spirochaetaceae bacterium]
MVSSRIPFKITIASILLLLSVFLYSQEMVISPEDFVFVEGGTFQIGSTNGGDEGEPLHTVTVTDFYIGKYEVTQDYYQDVMGTNPSDNGTGIGENFPVNRVSWYDAINFCNSLSEMEGLEPAYLVDGNNVIWDWNKNGYRLPTEAEWEYAARGGNSGMAYDYSGSNTVGTVAWYLDNSVNTAHPVGGKSANELGIYDMSGNVFEWCWDWYGDYTSESQQDPQGASSGSRRVFRGGSWRSYASSSLSTNRGDFNPSGRFNGVGFRLARSVHQ